MDGRKCTPEHGEILADNDGKKLTLGGKTRIIRYHATDDDPMGPDRRVHVDFIRGDPKVENASEEAVREVEVLFPEYI